MFNKAENHFRQFVDTTVYNRPATPEEGSDVFKRLTLDLGLGVDIPIGADLFVFVDTKTFVPTTHYPSPLLHQNKNVPLLFMLNVGFRILFDKAY